MTGFRDVPYSLAIPVTGTDDVWVRSLPPHDPIDWSDENAWMFLNGAISVRRMTRAEFEAEYPSP